MVTIKYRHYKPGDEGQLADLCNRAFQMNGGGFLRTSKEIIWRYIQSPGFEPEQIQIAEDVDNHKIVGSIYANMVEMVPIEGKDYLFGDINDVSCHPEYIKRGIARELMKMAINYMENKGCDYSLLVADYNGFPRKKIYLKFGYEDVERSNVFFHIPNIMQFIRYLPIAIPLFLPLLLATYIPRIINRLKFKSNSFFKDVSYEINHNHKHDEYAEALNSIMPKYYEGIVPYTKERRIWARINSPAEHFKPTYIIMKKNQEIIGGATITHQNMYALKFGIKVRIGIIHDLFLDKTVFKTRRELHLGYSYLTDKMVKAATRRNMPAIIYQVSPRDVELSRGLRAFQFLSFKGSAVMVKSIKEGLKFPKSLKKPLFVPTYINMGNP